MAGVLVLVILVLLIGFFGEASVGPSIASSVAGSAGDLARHLSSHDGGKHTA
jgi:hypothetical protein